MKTLVFEIDPEVLEKMLERVAKKTFEEYFVEQLLNQESSSEDMPSALNDHDMLTKYEVIIKVKYENYNRNRMLDGAKKLVAKIIDKVIPIIIEKLIDRIFKGKRAISSLFNFI